MPYKAISESDFPMVQISIFGNRELCLGARQLHPNLSE